MKDSANVSALPGGNRNTDGSFNNVGSNGNWWSATEQGTEHAQYWEMSSNRNSVANPSDLKDRGEKSLRCVQDVR